LDAHVGQALAPGVDVAQALGGDEALALDVDVDEALVPVPVPVPVPVTLPLRLPDNGSRTQ